MPNLSEYIVPSSDVQINMTFSGIPSMKLDTGSRLNWANSQSVQDIFAISHVDPIGIVALNATYTASVTMQSGEYNALMDAINAAAPAGQLYASMLEVAGFTLTCAYALKNAGTPKSAIGQLPELPGIGCQRRRGRQRSADSRHYLSPRNGY